MFENFLVKCFFILLRIANAAIFRIVKSKYTWTHSGIDILKTMLRAMSTVLNRGKTKMKNSRKAMKANFLYHIIGIQCVVHDSVQYRSDFRAVIVIRPYSLAEFRADEGKKKRNHIIYIENWTFCEWKKSRKMIK